MPSWYRTRKAMGKLHHKGQQAATSTSGSERWAERQTTSDAEETLRANPTADIVATIVAAMGVVEDVETTSLNLKGTYQNALKDVAMQVRLGMSVLTERGASGNGGAGGAEGGHEGPAGAETRTSSSRVRVATPVGWGERGGRTGVPGPGAGSLLPKPDAGTKTGPLPSYSPQCCDCAGRSRQNGTLHRATTRPRPSQGRHYAVLGSGASSDTAGTPRRSGVWWWGARGRRGRPDDVKPFRWALPPPPRGNERAARGQGGPRNCPLTERSPGSGYPTRPAIGIHLSQGRSLGTVMDRLQRRSIWRTMTPRFNGCVGSITRRLYLGDSRQALEKMVKEITKTSDSIRKKHRALKTGKMVEDAALERHFRPIIEPLQKLADNTTDDTSSLLIQKDEPMSNTEDTESETLSPQKYNQQFAIEQIASVEVRAAVYGLAGTERILYIRGDVLEGTQFRLNAPDDAVHCDDGALDTVPQSEQLPAKKEPQPEKQSEEAVERARTRPQRPGRRRGAPEHGEATRGELKKADAQLPTAAGSGPASPDASPASETALPALTVQPQRTCLQLRNWRLIPLELPPPRRTRPSRQTLTPWDVRVRRNTSPSCRPWAPAPLSPLPPSPARETAQQATGRDKREQGTQTRGWSCDSEEESDTQPIPDRWGPILVTLTAPHISYRERRIP
ncbi:hypothetical protein DMN91_003507 [Ooceraea biroi]|uniref:Uncharacterized protein n=1 Tax=Ooceraea biroi TaxID=2015173 RepID=A0A3L8DT08_OOCBI|nr:hypothetical protein DMN91_003507 [Ooceraea biroi]